MNLKPRQRRLWKPQTSASEWLVDQFNLSLTCLQPDLRVPTDTYGKHWYDSQWVQQAKVQCGWRCDHDRTCVSLPLAPIRLKTNKSSTTGLTWERNSRSSLLYRFILIVGWHITTIHCCHIGSIVLLFGAINYMLFLNNQHFSTS